MDSFEQNGFGPYGGFGSSQVDPLRVDGRSHLPLDYLNTQDDLAGL
jgi:hypothetical protein